MTTHPLVVGLFASADKAISAARALRDMGVPHERVSIVARSHDEEGVIARASGGSPGSELEDSATAARIGEIGAHLLSAVALVMPGIGPIVADGPLAAGLAEAAGHVAGRSGPDARAARGSIEPKPTSGNRRSSEGHCSLAHTWMPIVMADARHVLTDAGAERIATVRLVGLMSHEMSPNETEPGGCGV